MVQSTENSAERQSRRQARMAPSNAKRGQHSNNTSVNLNNGINIDETIEKSSKGIQQNSMDHIKSMLQQP
jgi:hypothetical protein